MKLPPTLLWVHRSETAVISSAVERWGRWHVNPLEGKGSEERTAVSIHINLLLWKKASIKEPKLPKYLIYRIFLKVPAKEITGRNRSCSFKSTIMGVRFMITRLSQEELAARGDLKGLWESFGEKEETKKFCL